MTSPDARGWFGDFGGRLVPETLVAPMQELEEAYFAAREDAFLAETSVWHLTVLTWKEEVEAGIKRLEGDKPKGDR